MIDSAPAAEVPETLAPGIPLGVDPMADDGAGPAAPPLAAPGGAIGHAAAAALLEREARALGEDPAAAQLLAEAGRIHEERLGDATAALALYRSAIEIDRFFEPAIEAARRLAQASGDEALACELYDLERRAARDPRDASDLALARARSLAALGRAEEAREEITAAAGVDPTSVAAVECEAALASAEGRGEDLARAWEECAARAGGDAAAPWWLLAAAAVEERLGHLDRARDLSLRAFRLDPVNAAARDTARRHAEDRPEDLAAVLEADARATRDPRDAALAWLALARHEEERLHRPERAREARDAARRASGDDPVALDALARQLEASEDWEPLAEVLRARAERGGGEDRGALVAGNLRLGEICDERLGRADEAAACYRAALALEPGHRGALAALGRLHARAGDWERVLETFLAERDAATDPRERAQRCARAAGVLAERLGRHDDAAALYEDALALEPGLLAAQAPLELLYERGGRYQDLDALLERDLEATPEPAERIALLFRIARLREDRLGDVGGAARAYERVLEAAPDHVVALRALAALHDRAGHHEALVAVHERLANLTADPRKRIALLQRAAEAQEEGLHDAAAAIAVYERILAIDPTHGPALRALGRLYAAAGRWPELVAMYRAEAEAAPSAEAAAALLHRMGEILRDRLGRDDDAIAAWREVLMLSPSHSGALVDLGRVYRERGEWESFADVLHAQAAACDAPAARAAVLCEAAEACERRLGDDAHAADLHEEALAAVPGFTSSLRALDRILSRRGRWADLARHWTSAAEHLAGGERAAALVEAARLTADRVGDAEGARRACQAALAAGASDPGALLLRERLDPAGAGAARMALAARLADERSAAGLYALAALDRARAADDGREALLKAVALAPAHPVAAPIAEARLREEGDHAGRARHLEARRDGEQAASARALWALRAGEAWQDAGEPACAMGAFRESLALVPDAIPALQALLRAQVRACEWSEARATLLVEAAALRDPGLACAAFAEAAAIALQRLDDRDGAVADLRRALERDPRDTAVASRLTALLEASGRSADLCEVRELWARAEREPGRAAAAWLEAARFTLERTGDAARALAQLDRALEADPASQPALLERGRLLAAGGRAQEAARDLAACAQDGATAPAAHLQLAALYQGPLPDPRRAASHLAAALAAAPDDQEILAQAARSYHAAGNWPAAADALRHLLALPALPPERAVTSLVALADVRAEGFGDVAGARQLCERALALAPGDPAALERAERLRARSVDGGGVVATLAAATAAAPDGPARARAHLRAARVLAGALGELQPAIGELRRALEADPACLDARRALAELCAESDPSTALEQHRVLLEQDPVSPDSWRALYALFQATKAHDRAFVVAGALQVLRLADATADGAWYAETAEHAPLSTAQALAPAEWLALRHTADRGPLSALLVAAGDALGEFGAVPGAPREKLKRSPSVSGLVSEACALFGVDEPILLAGEGVEVTAEPGDPAALRIGPELTRRLAPAEQRFLVARAVARLRARSGVAARLGAARLGELLAALVRQAFPDFTGIAEPSDALVKAVGRALSRKVRKALEGPARAVTLAGALDVAAWQAALSFTADRAGLLFAADLPASLGLVLRSGGDRPRTPEEMASSIRARPAAAQLLTFAVSEEHFRLRQRLKLTVA